MSPRRLKIIRPQSLLTSSLPTAPFRSNFLLPILIVAAHQSLSARKLTGSGRLLASAQVLSSVCCRSASLAAAEAPDAAYLGNSPDRLPGNCISCGLSAGALCASAAAATGRGRKSGGTGWGSAACRQRPRRGPPCVTGGPQPS